MKLYYSIGGYFNSSNFEFRYRKGELICTLSDIPGAPFQEIKTVTVKGNPEWERLLQFLKACKWQNEYVVDACDGTQWELRASRRKHFRLKVYGSNDFPPDFGQFEELLNKLIISTGWQLNESFDIQSE